MKGTIFWDITPRTPLLASAFTLVSCSAYSSTLKIEATGSSETSVDFQRATRRHILEASALHPNIRQWWEKRVTETTN
jgi:hypothetical protein